MGEFKDINEAPIAIGDKVAFCALEYKNPELFVGKVIRFTREKFEIQGNWAWNSNLAPKVKILFTRNSSRVVKL